MTILAVFRSRAQALGCLAAVKAAGVPAQVVSTPKEAGVGCGLSVKFDARFFERARLAVSRGRYSAFWGYLGREGTRYERI